MLKTKNFGLPRQNAAQPLAERTSNYPPRRSQKQSWVKTISHRSRSLGAYPLFYLKQMKTHSLPACIYMTNKACSMDNQPGTEFMCFEFMRRVKVEQKRMKTISFKWMIRRFT